MASTISAELKIVGDLTSDGDIEIDGRVEGKINGRTVTVGPRGHVHGAILAQSVRIKGAIEGEIGAMNVAFEASAVVKANITYKQLSVDEGAFFVGSVHGTDSKEPSG
jgi:cytoskeletal protein CcmA (bactofilin family)